MHILKKLYAICQTGCQNVQVDMCNTIPSVFCFKLSNLLLTEYVFLDGATSLAHEGLDESSEEWLTDCFNVPELQIGSEDM